MKGNSAVPGGLLQSEPTCWSTFRCSSTSAFFVLVSRPGSLGRGLCPRQEDTEDAVQEIFVEI